MEDALEKQITYGTILESNFLKFLEENPPMIRVKELNINNNISSLACIKIKKVPMSIIYEGFDEAMINPQDTNTFYIDAYISGMVKDKLYRIGMDGLLIQNPRGALGVLTKSIYNYQAKMNEPPPPHPLAIMLQSIGSDDGDEFFLAYT